MGNHIEKNGFKANGTLAQKNGIYQMVVKITKADGIKLKPKWKSTGLKFKGNKSRAQAMLADFMQETIESVIVTSSQNSIAADSKTLLPEFIEKCIDFKEKQKPGTDYYISHNTARGYRCNLKKHIEPYFTKERGITVESLSAVNLEDFYEYLLGLGTIGENTVCHIHNLFSASYTLAVKKFKLVSANVAVAAERPSFEVKKFPFLSVKQMQEYLGGLSDVHGFLKTAILFACYYGMRRGEIAALKLDMFDFENNTFRVARRFIQDKDGSYTLEDGTKTGLDGARTHRLEPQVKAHVQQEIERQKIMKKLYGNKFVDDGYLLCWEDGRYIRPDYITKIHRTELARLSLPHVRFHDLRHSCAAALAAMGYSLHQIGDYLGHKDPKSTKRYAHLTINTRSELSGSLSSQLNA